MQYTAKLPEACDVVTRKPRQPQSDERKNGVELDLLVGVSEERADHANEDSGRGPLDLVVVATPLRLPLVTHIRPLFFIGQHADKQRVTTVKDSRIEPINLLRGCSSRSLYHYIRFISLLHFNYYQLKLRILIEY